MMRFRQFLQGILSFISSWTRVVGFVWRANPFFVFLLLCCIVVHGIMPSLQIWFTSAIIQSITNAIHHPKAATPFIQRALLFTFLQGGQLIVSSAASTFQQWIQILLQSQLSNFMGVQIMEKAMTLDIRYFEDDVFYDKLQRANQESIVRSYQMFILMNMLGTQLITLISVSAVLFSWNWWLAFLILLSPLPSVIAQTGYGRLAYQMDKERSALRRMLTYLQKLVTSAQSIKEVRLFHLSEYFLEQYRHISRDFYSKDSKLAKRQYLILLPLGLISNFAALGAQIYAIFSSVASGSIGMLVGYLQAIPVIQGSVSSLLTLVNQVYQCYLFMGNLFEFFDIPPSETRSGQLPFPTPLQKGIEFRNVSFQYPGTSKTVLHDITFFLPAGKTASLVGKNGSGKTTIVKLLTRLYEPTSGQIFIDDIPLEMLEVNDLQRNIGILFQDFVHYEMTARDNIGFGNIEQLENEVGIRAAAKYSGIASEIDRLPKKYETTLGRMFAKGHEFSGGQWQKIALARVFMRKSPIVILDEPTAAIDAKAEAEIFDRLQHLLTGVTTILIAHRFSTIRLADYIFVLEDGRIVEEGNHQSLMQVNGSYASLFRLQASGYKEYPKETDQPQDVFLDQLKPVLPDKLPQRKQRLKRLLLRPMNSESDIA